MLGKFLGGLVGLLGGLMILAQLVLVPLAEKALIQAASGFPVEKIVVEIQSFPPWELLQGRLDEIFWQVEGLQFQDWTLEGLEGRFVEIELSWFGLWNKSNLHYSFQEPGEVTGTLTEENLQQYLRHRLGAPVEGLTVMIEGQQIKLAATWPIAGQKLPLELIGRLELVGSSALRLVPEKIKLGSFVPGPDLQARLLGNTIFPLPLDSLPLKLEMYELQGGEGKIIFKAWAFPQSESSAKE